MTIVYKYYVRMSKEQDSKLGELLFQYNQARNAAVEVYRASTTGYREARNRVVPGYEEITSAYQELREEAASIRKRIKAARQAVNAPDSAGKSPRKRVKADVGNDELAVVADRLKALKPRYLQAKELEKASEELKAEAAKIYNLKLAAQATNRKRALYSESIGLAEEAAEAASTGAMNGAKEHGGDGLPRFRRFDGSGRLGVRWTKHTTGGVPVASLFSGSNTGLQITPLPEEQWETHVGRRRAITPIRFRVGSDEKRKPVWADATILMHRPLPKAKAQRACLVARAESGRRRWELHITLSNGEVRAIGHGAASLRICFKREPNGDVVYGILNGEETLRFAFDATRSAGRDSRSVLERLAHAHGIKSVADRLVDESKADLFRLEQTGWLPAGTVPTNFASWRSRKTVATALSKVAELWSASWVAWAKWKTERLALGLDLRATAEQHFEFAVGNGATDDTHKAAFHAAVLCAKLRHLDDWYRGESKRAIGCRNDTYSKVARDLSDRFERVDVEYPKLNVRRPKAEAAKGHASGVHSLRVKLAISEFKLAIQKAFGPDRCTITSYGPARELEPGELPCDNDASAQAAE